MNSFAMAINNELAINTNLINKKVDEDIQKLITTQSSTDLSNYTDYLIPMPKEYKDIGIYAFDNCDIANKVFNYLSKNNDGITYKLDVNKNKGYAVIYVDTMCKELELLFNPEIKDWSNVLDTYIGDTNKGCINEKIKNILKEKNITEPVIVEIYRNVHDDTIDNDLMFDYNNVLYVFYKAEQFVECKGNIISQYDQMYLANEKGTSQESIMIADICYRLDKKTCNKRRKLIIPKLQYCYTSGNIEELCKRLQEEDAAEEYYLHERDYNTFKQYSKLNHMFNEKELTSIANIYKRSNTIAKCICVGILTIVVLLVYIAVH